MRAFLLALLLASAPPALADEQPPPTQDGPTLVEAYAMPIVTSLGAVGAGALGLVAVMASGAAVGLLAGDTLRVLAPSFFPPDVQDGPLGPASQGLIAAMVGAAIVAPVAVLAGLLADWATWLLLVHPVRPRAVGAALVAGALGVAVTIPTLVVTCAMMALVAIAARWEADKLAVDPSRQAVMAALGWGLPILFLGVPLAVIAASLRGVVFGVVGQRE